MELPEYIEPADAKQIPDYLKLFRARVEQVRYSECQNDADELAKVCRHKRQFLEKLLDAIPRDSMEAYHLNQWRQQLQQVSNLLDSGAPAEISLAPNAPGAIPCPQSALNENSIDGSAGCYQSEADLHWEELLASSSDSQTQPRSIAAEVFSSSFPPQPIGTALQQEDSEQVGRSFASNSLTLMELQSVDGDIWDLEESQRREAELVSMLKDMEGLQALQTEISTFVNAQGDDLHRVEHDMSNAKVNVSEGSEELSQAKEIKSTIGVRRLSTGFGMTTGLAGGVVCGCAGVAFWGAALGGAAGLAIGQGAKTVLRRPSAS